MNAQPDKAPPPTGHSPLLDYMIESEIPLTRKNYLDLNYPEGPPEPWTQELENDIPPEVRDK